MSGRSFIYKQKRKSVYSLFPVVSLFLLQPTSLISTVITEVNTLNVQDLFGVIQCKLLPPRRLRFPVFRLILFGNGILWKNTTTTKTGGLFKEYVNTFLKIKRRLKKCLENELLSNEYKKLKMLMKIFCASQK